MVAVSVVVPVHNGLPHILEQVEALARQATAVPFEVIVVDNRSTDGTATAVAEATAGDGRFRVVPAAEKASSYFARNMGAALATGDLLAFCDADDVVTENWVDALWRHRGDGQLLAGRVESARLQGHTWESPDRGLQVLMGFKAFSETANLAVDAAVFREVGGFDETYKNGGDVEFCWRAQLAGATIAYVPAAMIHKRDRSTYRELLRQRYLYGRVQPRLYKAFRSAGLRRRSPVRIVGGLVKLGLWLLAFPLADDHRRRRTLREAGTIAGRVSGSVVWRSLYL